MVARKRYVQLQRVEDNIRAAHRRIDNAAGAHVRHDKPVVLALSGLGYDTQRLRGLLGIHDRNTVRLDYSALLRGYLRERIAENRGVIR